LKDQPLVSILLLSMNHEHYIEQCINSIINQTYQNIEIVYLDNASHDNTFQVGKALLEKSNIPIRIFFNKESKTISYNLNFLFDQSSGSYVSPLSADDWFQKDNIEKKVNYLVGNADTEVIFSNGWFYDEPEKKIQLNDSAAFMRGNIYKEVLTHADCIFYVGVMYKREIIKRVGKWDESLLIEDTDMYIRIGMVAKIDFLNEPLVYYRRTSTSASKNNLFMLRGFRQYYQKYKNVKWINMRNWLAERYRSIAASKVDQGNNKQALTFLIQAIRLNPVGMKNLRTLFYLIKRSF
jgi:teichuronic acid biosynthesis glycosyltransferase TuaG